MATSKQLKKKMGGEIKRAKFEIRKLAVTLKKGQQQQKKLESKIKNLTKDLQRARFRPAR
jgi:septal ring factor EnvC (AmiA/AmiB activator)